MYYRGTYAERITQENKELKRRIELLESAEAVQKLKADYEKVIRSKEEKMRRFKKGWDNCLTANKELKMRNSELWKEQMRLRRELKQAAAERERAVREKISASDKLSKKENENDALRARHEADKETIRERDRQIEALKDKISELEALRDHDGTTSGIPTSQTPRDKKKVIPNTREKTGRHRGGQPGHEKKTLKKHKDEAVTEDVDHTEEKCLECGGELEKLEEYDQRDEIDYEVRVIRRRHHFYVYRCKECGKEYKSEIPLRLASENQYGPVIQAMTLALLDLGFVSTGRARTLLSGIVGEENTPSLGYIGKIQHKAARMLKEFREEVREEVIRQELVHWDDTVVWMNTKRACFRFYGNERLALYYAHEAKDAAGLKSDHVLSALGRETTVMHDHLRYNYRKEFLFRNIECVQHLERDLQELSNDTGHEWPGEMKELISSTIHLRKQYLKEGKNIFGDEETDRFEEKLEECLTKAERESENDRSRYYHQDECAVIKRIKEYKENYFAWVYDFTLPTTNNLAESSLRMIKTKLKVSGQFGKEKTADDFALVRTYTETCRRNGINEMQALRRVMEGTPYTVKELFRV